MYSSWVATSFAETFTVPPGTKYCCWQREKCPETGREHFQVFIEFESRKRFSTVKNLLGEGCHIERCMSRSKAKEYCSKTETRVAGPWEHGVFVPEAATKTKLNPVQEFRSGKRLNQVLEENPQVWRSIRALREVQVAVSKPRSEMTTGICLTGSTGVGKSKVASLIASYLPHDEVCWMADSSLQWFDGYNGTESLVIVDEWREIRSPSHLLRCIDRYPMRVPVKGGFVNWRPTVVIFTTNLPEAVLMGGLDQATCEAIKRRIKFLNVY